jgi:hypothetical protein
VSYHFFLLRAEMPDLPSVINDATTEETAFGFACLGFCGSRLFRF